MYTNDPESPEVREASKRDGAGKILGGEASMWTSKSIQQHWMCAFGRACANRRLWSPNSTTADVNAAAPRLSQHRCRLLAFTDVSAGPIWSDYCSAAYDSPGKEAQSWFSALSFLIGVASTSFLGFSTAMVYLFSRHQRPRHNENRLRCELLLFFFLNFISKND